MPNFYSHWTEMKVMLVYFLIDELNNFFGKLFLPFENASNKILL